MNMKMFGLFITKLDLVLKCNSGGKKIKNEIILITAVDEIFPIISIEKMLEEILNKNYDFKN